MNTTIEVDSFSVERSSTITVGSLSMIANHIDLDATTLSATGSISITASSINMFNGTTFSGSSLQVIAENTTIETGCTLTFVNNYNIVTSLGTGVAVGNCASGAGHGGIFISLLLLLFYTTK